MKSVRLWELQSVAHDIACACVGRNNDLNGYWALGILMAVARDREIERIEFDLLLGTASQADERLIDLGPVYSGLLFKQMERRKIARRRIVRAAVGFSFDFGRSRPSPFSDQLVEHPFAVTVTIHDHSTLVHEECKKEWCWPHNPEFESRSTRASLA